MARFAVSDFQEQSAAVWIVTLLLLSYTTLTTLVRWIVKLKLMGLDDGIASFAQLLTYGNVICVIYALLHGFAKARQENTATPAELEYGKAIQASIVLYLLALATAKIAVILFLRRAFRRANYTNVLTLCNVAIAAFSIWGIGASVGVSINCSLDHLWQTPGSPICNKNTAWLVVAVLDCSTEVGILLVAIWLVSQLQMKVTKKATVLIAFVWRLGLIVLATYHYRSYRRTLQSSTTDIAISRMVIWEQSSVCYSLLSLTWPFSKSFINSFDTAPLEAASAYGSGAGISDTAGRRKSKMGLVTNASNRPWENSGIHSSAAYSRPTAVKRDNESFGSQEMIIRRDDEVAVTFDYDHPTSSNKS